MKRVNLVSKLKIKVSQAEGKNIGELYHFTSMPSLKGILSNNCLRKGYSVFQNSILKITKPVVSLSRNRNLNKQYSTARGFDVRLIVDGDRLSDNYKITPAKEQGSSSGEAEEIIMADIEGFDRYLKEIDVLDVDNFETYLMADSSFAGRVDALKRKGVKIVYV